MIEVTVAHLGLDDPLVKAMRPLRGVERVGAVTGSLSTRQFMPTLTRCKG